MAHRTFASDNNAGAHPEILRAIEAANDGHAAAYGEDPWTVRAEAAFRRLFGDGIEVFFVFGGTGANVSGLRAITKPWSAVICAESSHIHNDECGAPERFTGCKLLPLRPTNGKLLPAQIAPQMAWAGDTHHVQPAVVSVAQATEYGTVYTPSEMRALADAAHAHGLRLHVDGARFANAVASIGGAQPAVDAARSLTTGAGVDVLSFGGTKNGLVFGEAVVFFDRSLAADFGFLRKQAMQLPSKMRFVAAQFEALLEEGLWLRSAARANALARRLEAAVKAIPGLRITQPVEANSVFAVIPREAIERIRARSPFYTWDEPASEVRWMTSFDTTEEDVDAFAAFVRESVSR